MDLDFLNDLDDLSGVLTAGENSFDENSVNDSRETWVTPWEQPQWIPHAPADLYSIFLVNQELFVGNIPVDADESQLVEYLFSPHRYRFHTQKRGERFQKKFAFFNYTDFPSWAAALQRNQQKWYGFDLVVKVNYQAGAGPYPPGAGSRPGSEPTAGTRR
jgi:hypothetical protein